MNSLKHNLLHLRLHKKFVSRLIEEKYSHLLELCCQKPLARVEASANYSKYFICLSGFVVVTFTT